MILFLLGRFAAVHFVVVQAFYLFVILFKPSEQIVSELFHLSVFKLHFLLYDQPIDAAIACNVSNLISRIRIDRAIKHHDLKATPATRMIHSGQSAYVEPQSCCERNAPCAAAINTNGKTRAVPLRRLKVKIANADETINMNGQTASRRSALS